MFDPHGREYGLIRLVRVDGQPKYRAEFRVAWRRVHHQ
jgi:hypothetical protein